MEGKVENVERTEWFSGAQSIQNSSTYHNIRHTNTFATLENGDRVNLDERDILESYKREKFSENLICDLKNKLVGETISYKHLGDEYYLDGSISQYLKKHEQ